MVTAGQQPGLQAPALVAPVINAERQAEMRRLINSFKIDQLKAVLAQLNLTKSGRKAELVARIFNYWTPELSLANLTRLKAAIELAASGRFSPYTVLPRPAVAIALPRPAVALALPRPQIPRIVLPLGIPPLPAPLIPTAPVVIESSLLYQDIQVIATSKSGPNCEKPPIHMRFQLDDTNARLMESQQLNGKPSPYRVVLVCGRLVPRAAGVAATPLRIEYPSGTNAHMNGIFLNTQFMCDSHVDLPHISIRGFNELKLQFYYVPSVYVFQLKLVKNRSNEEIIKYLQDTKMTKEEILKSRKSVNNETDDDIVAGDEVVLLLDPFSRCRISIPVRGRNCKHTQCFDAFTYLEINKTRPNMECPICYAKLPLGQLMLDGLFEEILKSTKDDVEQVNVKIDGAWSLIEEKSAFIVSERHNASSSALHNVLSSDIVLLADSPSPQKNKQPIFIVLDSDDD